MELEIYETIDELKKEGVLLNPEELKLIVFPGKPNTDEKLPVCAEKIATAAALKMLKHGYRK